MTNRWQRIDHLFHGALELKPGVRAQFLASACEGDQELRQEVESLLAKMESPIDIIDNPPAVEAIQLLAREDRPSLEGQTIQHYQILSLIGEGGMGEVYAALDQRLNRKVALKFLPASFTQDEEQVRRLHHEARAASVLKHPNIVTIYDLGQTDSRHFIAMEFIEGATLRQKLNAKMPFREILNIAIQVASGLAAAHQAGILHRDIKPENIMSGDDGYVKILDFGIAKFKEHQATGETSLTTVDQLSVAAGTLSYMSPEQARGETLDARTDIFSLGVLLFELTTGQRPFAGDTQAETLQSLLNSEAPPLSTLRHNIPADLENVVRKALKKNRDERYQSAREMLADLREFDRKAGKDMDETQRANRMLRQYLSIYAVDNRALIPLRKLAVIRQHSDLEKGERGGQLLKKSLRVGLVKSGALLLLASVVTTILAAYFSIEEKWDEVILKDGHTRAARQAAFSPDGKWLVSVGEDAKIIIWDFARRLPVITLTKHEKPVTSVDFSPDGKWFATGSEDNTVIVWDAKKFEQVAVLQGHRDKVIAVAFSSDGRWLASASYESPEDRIILTEVDGWREVRQMMASSWDYGKLIFSPNNRWLSFADGTHWDISTGQPVTADVVGWTGRWMAQSRDGKNLIGVGSSGAVNSFNVPRHQSGEQVLAHHDSGRAAAFSLDGRFVATGADDIVIWDALTMRNLGRLGYDAPVWHAAFSPDGKWLVSTHGDGAIVVWDVEDRKQAAVLNGHGGPVRSVAFSADGRHIASAAEDSSVILWNLLTGRKEEVVLASTSHLRGVALSPDSGKLLYAEFDRGAVIWNRVQQRADLSLKTDGSNYCVAISPDERWVVTTEGVYANLDGRQVMNFRERLGAKAQMYSTAFSADGRWLIAASPSKILALFDTTSWELRGKIVSDVDLISVSFSPNSKQLVTGDDQGSVRLWGIEPLRQLFIIGRHTSRVKSVAFSPNGREVCSAGDDQMIALWDLQTPGLVTKIGTHTAPVLAVAFSPDGKRIASGEHDSSVRVYSRHRELWGWRLN